MFARRAGRAWVMPLLFVAVSCGGRSPAAPSTNTLGTSLTVSALRIIGLPESLSPGATAPLHAETTLGNGSVKECAATWSVDDPKVATISDGGVLSAQATGYVSVSAVCSGLSAVASATVRTACPYKLIIVAYDSEVRSEFGVVAAMEFLDGERAGERITTGSIYTNGITIPSWPVRVRFSADSYASREFVLSEATGTRRNNTSPLFDFEVPMTFVGDAWTDTYVRTMSKTDMEFSHPFSMKTAGDVQVRTWWSVDYNDVLFIELWCGGTLLRQVPQQFGSNGGGFTHRVDAPGACEVRLRQLKSDASTHYRVAIRYSH